MINVLFTGEVVGKAGVFCLKQLLPELKEKADIVIVNGDGVTGGYGIGKNHSVYLRKLGADVITSGECIYYKKDMVPHIQKAPYIIRAANYPPGNPGRGWKVIEHEKGKVAVINMLGQAGFNRIHPNNPFTYVKEIIKRLSEETNMILIDFHAATTAEKHIMFHHVAGHVSAVIGTHARAITADAKIMEEGTAVITDAGKVGSLHSVAGLEPSIEINKLKTQIPERSKAGWNGTEFQGVFLSIDEKTGKATHIEHIRRILKEGSNDGSGDSHSSKQQPSNA